MRYAYKFLNKNVENSTMLNFILLENNLENINLQNGNAKINHNRPAFIFWEINTSVNVINSIKTMHLQNAAATEFHLYYF